MSLRLFSILILSSLVLGGCSKYLPKLDKVIPDHRKDYQKSKSLPDLEVPPDLTTDSIDDSMAVPDIDETGTATFSTYQERVARQRENRQLLSSPEDASVVEVSGEQLIVVPASTSDTWLALHDFWKEKGYTLDIDDEELGFMETDWRGNDTQREKFKVFVEPSSEQPGHTNIYFSHRSEMNEDGEWVEQDRDLQLERRMALSIREALGGISPSAATSIAATDNTEIQNDATERLQSELINAGEGRFLLSVNTDPTSLWPRVGEILKQSGDFSIEDQDQGKGIYEVVYQGKKEKKSLLKKLAFWKGDDTKFKVSLAKAGNKTEIVVLDEDGEWATSAAADQILDLIRSNL